MYAWIHRKRAGKITEDEVTSCVFGPLRMAGGIEPERTWAACLHIFRCDHLFSKDFEPTHVSVRFWPRFPLGQRRYVESDVHVIARRGADVRTILVEVKCGAGLGDDQLLHQWTSISVARGEIGWPGTWRRRVASPIGARTAGVRSAETPPRHRCAGGSSAHGRHRVGKSADHDDVGPFRSVGPGVARNH